MSLPTDVPIPNTLERRWRIGVPPLPHLLDALKAESVTIELTFLCGLEGERSIGKRIHCEGTTFFTTMRSVSDTTCAENNRVIGESEFRTLEAQRDPNRRTIVKTRWRFTFKGTRFALDLFADPPGIALLESEPVDPELDVTLPRDFLDILEEVTGDKAYDQNRLALRAA